MSDRGRERIAAVLADAVRDAEPSEVPERLCAAAVRLLPVSGAGVALWGEGIPVPLSASSARAEQLMEMQATLGDGPCLRAAETGAAVYASDLTAGRDAVRWPVFAQQAAAAGVRAVYALPLGGHMSCVGTLDLYRDVPGELAGDEVRTAQLVADVLTAALMALPLGEDDGLRPPGEEPWLSALATDHDVVHQAVGMVMAQLGIDAGEALARLRAHAFAQGRTVLDEGREVVGRRTRLDDRD
ncbi:GAF and ANTAR domain-containing protein [Streptomyces sp. NBC_00582]|uniref:GAF and ANTAR domain-containing protein n=1 Tax=Streptomyces sp. NBC_00582 TaxID=2975783 RepID=UPI002E80B16F|nr:GAF and ANTAR domain-containing protein [Streptomyces sp. NBC_00582]WUB63188.1 GAF and ANTAR domain-containing protein [Streptomyces sp. NBC_00582]